MHLCILWRQALPYAWVPRGRCRESFVPSAVRTRCQLADFAPLLCAEHGCESFLWRSGHASLVSLFVFSPSLPPRFPALSSRPLPPRVVLLRTLATADHCTKPHFTLCLILRACTHSRSRTAQLEVGGSQLAASGRRDLRAVSNLGR